MSLQQIKTLRKEKDSLNESLVNIISDTIPFTQIVAELKAIVPTVQGFEYGVYKTTDFKTTKELPTFHLKWKRKNSSTRAQEKKVKAWLKERLQLEEVRVISY